MPSAVFVRPCLLALGLLVGAVSLPAEPVAVNSMTFNGYARTQLPDGTFKQELYTFGEGGCWSRAIKDPWMEKLKFIDVARAVAGPLAKMNFQPGQKAADVQLLIMVYWGSTQGSSDFNPNDVINRAAGAIAGLDRAAQDDLRDNPDAKPKDGTQQSIMERKVVDSRTPEGAAYENALWQLGVSNRMRDDLDERNARILGYSESLDRARFALTTSLSKDVLQELGGNRYYVVLQAFDFKTAMSKKKLRPQWTTRLSVSESGAFGEALNRMIWSGNRFFGRDTNGLKREREATVELPPVKFLEEAPPQK